MSEDLAAACDVVSEDLAAALRAEGVHVRRLRCGYWEVSAHAGRTVACGTLPEAVARAMRPRGYVPEHHELRALPVPVGHVNACSGEPWIASAPGRPGRRARGVYVDPVWCSGYWRRDRCPDPEKEETASTSEG